MIVLDTDHLTYLQREGSAIGVRIRDRVSGGPDLLVATTIINFEEQIRGRLAVIAKSQTRQKLVSCYADLERLVAFYRNWRILGFDESAAILFDRLRSQRIRIGTMDLRISCVVLAHGATLLSSNLGDFRQVPGLLVEDWVHS